MKQKIMVRQPNHPKLLQRLRGCLMASALGAVSMSTLAAAANSWPTPGDYRIDSDTTTTSTAGPTSVERRQLVDGDTGNMSVVLRDTLAGSKPATQTYPGAGPNKWCVLSTSTSGSTTPPAKVLALCSDAKAPTGATKSCGLEGVVETWLRIDDRTWERTIRATQTPATDLASSSAAQQAMAPVFAGLEEAVRTGSAEEKEMAKQQLAMLRGTAAPKAAGGTAVVSKERWRRVAEVCPR